MVLFPCSSLCCRARFRANRPNPPAAVPSATTPSETASTTNPSTSPWFPPTLLLPQITPLTNPAVISPQAQLDYNLQIPLFGDLPFRKELSEKGIDFIAHYISQTASNTAGIHGTGTAYADQVDSASALTSTSWGLARRRRALRDDGTR